jgi:hypothetical protein
MTFDEAMRMVSTRHALVARPEWNIFHAIQRGTDGSLWRFKLDNCEGGRSGDGWPYKPTDEDRAATDWIFYQPPDENWVELSF